MSRNAALNQAVRTCEPIGQFRCQNTKTVTLETRNRETRYMSVGAGVRIDDSSGNNEILITQNQSEQAIFNSFNSLQTRGETIGTVSAKLHENGVPTAWSPANPNGIPMLLKQKRAINHRSTTKSVALRADSTTGKWLKRLKNQLLTMIF